MACTLGPLTSTSDAAVAAAIASISSSASKLQAPTLESLHVLMCAVTRNAADAMRAAGMNTRRIEAYFAHMGHIGTEDQQLLGYARAVIEHRPVRQVCEVGFNAGHSAALFLALTGTQNASYFALDLFDQAYSARALEWVSKAFPGRVRSIAGRSRAQLAWRRHPELRRCDVWSLDGDHSSGLLVDLRNAFETSVIHGQRRSTEAHGHAGGLGRAVARDSTGGDDGGVLILVDDVLESDEEAYRGELTRAAAQRANKCPHASSKTLRKTWNGRLFPHLLILLPPAVVCADVSLTRVTLLRDMRRCYATRRRRRAAPSSRAAAVCLPAGRWGRRTGAARGARERCGRVGRVETREQASARGCTHVSSCARRLSRPIQFCIRFYTEPRALKTSLTVRQGAPQVCVRLYGEKKYGATQRHAKSFEE